MSSKKKPYLLILGCYEATEGYPNTLYRIKAIRSLEDFETQELSVVSNLKRHQKHSYISKIKNFLPISLGLVSSHIRLFLKYFLLRKKPDLIYIPYPAILVLLIFSYFPGRWRPKKIIADAFISIYDTIVDDRKLLRSNSLLASLIFWIERRGYMSADVIVVDTQQNLDYLAKTFSIPSKKFLVIPLSTNEQDYLPSPYLQDSGIYKVLFIGTMIPLHGVEIILQAAKILSANRNIRFSLIGDGQEAYKVKSALADGLKNLSWTRNWQEPSLLAEEIRNSDICLGIFGNTEKTQRVCPLKLYSYLSIGRAVITAKSQWTDSVIIGNQFLPFETVSANDASALADKIKYLISTASHREQLAKQARRFYEISLSNEFSNSKLHQLLTDLSRDISS